MRLYTIGHGDVPLDSFLAELVKNHVTHVLDVRPHEMLHANPAYDPSSIYVSLLGKGIIYANMSDTLGQLAKEEESDEEFQSGLQRLMQIVMAEDRVVCLLGCSVRPEACHRATEIGENLSKMRMDLQHIEPGGTTPHDEVMRRPKF